MPHLSKKKKSQEPTFNHERNEYIYIYILINSSSSVIKLIQKIHESQKSVKFYKLDKTCEIEEN